MSTEFVKLLPLSIDEKEQIWLLGSRSRVDHKMSEFYAKRFVFDRVQSAPIVPARFAPGKFMGLQDLED